MKSIIRISCALLLISMSVALLLAVVNEITKPIIERTEKKNYENAILELFPGVSDIKIQVLDGDFDTNVIGFYTVSDGDTQVGFYAHVKVFGFKSDIEMLVGLNMSGEICGLEIVSHNETVGIGTKIEDRGFLDLFFGKKESIEYKKGANEDGYIDGISSATYSSKAVITGVSSALDAYNLYVNK